MSASSLPVVWCANRNSVDNKPTAFALQGIHLQGNISEQHVLAVRELINAASEGRLLLPADGGVVVLSCGGTGVGSLIVSSNENGSSNNKANTKGDNNDDKENKQEGRDKKSCSRNSDDVSNGEKNQRPIFSNSTNSNTSEVLYEFLCCARCMMSVDDSIKCNNRATQNSKIIEKYLDAKINAGKAIRRASNNHHKPIKLHRRKNKNSFKSENRAIIVSTRRVSNSLPIYATVNKSEKMKYRENKLLSVHRKKVDNIAVTRDQFNTSSVIHESFRKTSFDSTCTISSMDSGFMEMQSKIELTKALKNINNMNNNDSIATGGIIQQKQVNNSNNESSSIQIKIDTFDGEENIERNVIRMKSELLGGGGTWNRLNVPQQSKNRRKSYEEFKSLFCDHKNSLLINNNENTKSLSKSRRKSYEEFNKSVTELICENSINDLTTIKNNLNEDNACKTSSTSSNINFFTRIRRGGSKRFSLKKNNAKTSLKKSNQEQQRSSINNDCGGNNVSIGGSEEFTIYDILRKRDAEKNSIIEIANGKKFNYDKNLELFESHCNENNNNKHNDKNNNNNNLKSCGTIYDIIQNKSDISNVCSKKYDKYMTYGTIYEILHRKSGCDEGNQFDRKRTFSEKYTKNRQRTSFDNSSMVSIMNIKRVNTAAGKLENNNINDDQNYLKSVTDTNNNKNLNSSEITAVATANNSSLKQGNCNTNNQLSITSVNSSSSNSTKQLSTIYDILQTKKLDTSSTSIFNPPQPIINKNRFLVRKITEEELIEQSSSSTSTQQQQNKEGNKDESALDNIKDENSSCINNNNINCNDLIKKQTKLRRFSNILSYSTNKINHNNNNCNLDGVIETVPSLEIDRTQKFPIEDIYSRLNRTAHLKHEYNSTSTDVVAFEVENNVAVINKGGKIYKSNSLDNILKSNVEESQEFSIRQKQPFRKISVPAHLHLPPKILPKKSTRRLSEFTRGEFLNEKA